MATDLSVLDAAIIGLPSDAGAPFRPGARFAPNAVRAMSIMLRPINPYRDNINVFDVLRVADAGDALVVLGYEEETLARMEQAVSTLAELRAVAKRYGPVALVQFDSHSDTWDKYFADKRYSAGTPFSRGVEENIIDSAHSIQIGLRGSLFQTTNITQSLDLGFEVVTTDAMFEMGIAALAERIAGRPTFITFDMDFVDPAAAPAVETPEAGGPTARESLLLLRRLSGINLVGCDVTEITPTYDGPGQITSLLGATVMEELLALLASEKR
ncbi:arginase family protein [Candidatus Sodalis pierantonius]|nr:arginase family protein [Candidatus Sodalis pierantonius]